MFARFRKNFKMASRGLLTPDQATADIGKRMLGMMIAQRDNPKPNTPYFLRIMADNSDYYILWTKKYFPILDKALDRETVADQRTALRLFALESIEKLSSAVWLLHESTNPWKERPDSDRTILAKGVDSTATLEEFVDTCRYMALIDEASLQSTLFISEKYLGEDRKNFADAFGMLRDNVQRLRTEKTLSEAKGNQFTEQFKLHIYETMNASIREPIAEGRMVTMEAVQANLEKGLTAATALDAVMPWQQMG